MKKRLPMSCLAVIIGLVLCAVAIAIPLLIVNGQKYKYPDGITVPDLCEISGKDKSDASRMIAILEKKGLARKEVVGGSLYRGLWVLTDEGKVAAAHVCLRASRAVELAGKDLDDETRDIFYKALELITSNLTSLSKEGLPEQ